MLELNTITGHNANECAKETPMKQSNKRTNVLPPSPPPNQLLESVHCFYDKSNCHAWALCCVYILMILYLFCFCMRNITRPRVEYQLKIILQMQNHHPFRFSLQIQHSTRSMHLTVFTTENQDTLL